MASRYSALHREKERSCSPNPEARKNKINKIGEIGKEK
jgi:hypothetical protein